MASSAPKSDPTRLAVPSEPAEVELLRARLEAGTSQERLSALRRLIVLRAEAALTRCLSSHDPAVVQLAIDGLWECWLDEAGPDARAALEDASDLMSAGDLPGAVTAFEALIAAHPRWAEPVNKLATALYLQGNPDDSIARCLEVVALKPDHFGAWNGMAICAIQTEDWPLALRAVQESLRLQPRSPPNHQLLALVQARLRPTSV